MLCIKPKNEKWYFLLSYFVDKERRFLLILVK